MKIWLIYSLEDEHLLDALNKSVYNELLKAKCIEANEGQIYTFKRYHPTKDLVAAPFKIGKTPKWDRYILRHITENDLVKLTDDWSQEID